MDRAALYNGSLVWHLDFMNNFNFNEVIGGGEYGLKTDCRLKEQADHNILYAVAAGMLPERINRADVRRCCGKSTSGRATRLAGDTLKRCACALPSRSPTAGSL